MPVGAAASQAELETTGRCKTREQPLALCASSTVCRCHSPSEQGWGLLTSTRVFCCRLCSRALCWDCE